MSKYKNFKMTAWIVYAIPGTVIDINARIVRKDMSFIDPQRKFIETEVKPLRAKLVGMTAKPRVNERVSKILPQIPAN
jgi:hypothetical protein